MLQRIPRPVFILALLAILALGMAFGTNAIIAHKLAVAPQRLASAAQPAAQDGAPGTETSGESAAVDGAESAGGDEGRNPNLTRRLNYYQDPIVRRNLFDSSNSLKDTQPEVTEVTEDGEVKKSDLDALLVAASVASDPSWSSALIAVSGSAAVVYSIGDSFLDAEIVDILNPWLDDKAMHHPARVIVLRGGAREFLDAGQKPEAKARRKG